jgi:hypothetical protein
MAKKKKKRKPQDGKSLVWVAGASVVLVALFSWGCMANAYSGRIEEVVAGAALAPGRMRGKGLVIIIGAIIAFFVNAITQIPNLFPVISWNIANRKGLLIALALLQVFVIGVAWGLKFLEKQLEKGQRPPVD